MLIIFFSSAETVCLSGERLRQTLYRPVESQKALEESHGEFRCIAQSIDVAGQSVNDHYDNKRDRKWIKFDGIARARRVLLRRGNESTVV